MTRNRRLLLESKRIKIKRPVSLRFHHLEDFSTAMIENVSMTGMFIRSEEPQPPGTTFYFQLEVQKGWKVVQGRGRVVWVRHRDRGTGLPPGMGVAFIDIDDSSRRLIGELVEHQMHRRDTPERVERKPISRPASQPRARSRSNNSRLWLLGLALAGLIGVGIAGIVGDSRNGRRIAQTTNAEEPSPTPAGPTSVAEEPRPAPAPAAPSSAPQNRPAPTAAPVATSPAPPVSEPEPAPEVQIERAVRSWAEAWSSQDPDAYLAAYSQAFRPEDGSSRQAWAAQRRERVTAPKRIRVAVTQLAVTLQSPLRARAAFFQNYRSDTFEDTVRKQLELVKEEDGWKIVRERSITVDG